MAAFPCELWTLVVCVVVLMVVVEGRARLNSAQDPEDRAFSLEDVLETFEGGKKYGFPSGRSPGESEERSRWHLRSRFVPGKLEVVESTTKVRKLEENARNDYKVKGNGVFPEEASVRNDDMKSFGDGVFPGEVTVRAISNRDIGDGVFPGEVTVRAISNRDIGDGIFPGEVTVRAMNNRDVRD